MARGPMVQVRLADGRVAVMHVEDAVMLGLDYEPERKQRTLLQDKMRRGPVEEKERPAPARLAERIDAEARKLAIRLEQDLETAAEAIIRGLDEEE